MSIARASYVQLTLDEATLALHAFIDPRPLVSIVVDYGLLRWLTAVNTLQLQRKTLQAITQRAWNERCDAATLAQRFHKASLDSPFRYVLALRAAHLGFALSRGIIIRELIEATTLDRKNLYALLRQCGVPDALEQARRHPELWLAHACVETLMARIPPRVWAWPRLMRSGVA